jgi:small-conductance mechanosensitive channel
LEIFSKNYLTNAFVYSVPYLIEVAISIIIILLGIFINRFIVQKSIDKFGERTKLDIQQTKPLKKAASVILWLIILFIILGIFGLSDVLWGMFAAAGFAGIVVGMATRDIIGDMITGFMLYIYRPFEIGDAVAIDDIWGEVKDIGVGGVKVKAWSGEIVVIPNSKIRTTVVRNFSIDSRRATITFYVDYDSDFNKALKICKKALDGTPELLHEPAPVIRVDDFTEKSVRILILAWFPIDEFWDGYAKVKKNLAVAFRSQGLKIPVMRLEKKNEEF